MDYLALSVEDLVRACAETGEPEAWEEFVRRFQRPIATVALRVARRWGETSPQVIDELVQETYLKLCSDNARLLKSFQPKHPDAFYGYLKVVTSNLVHDHFKSAHSAKRGAGKVEVSTEPSEEGVGVVPVADGAAELTERQVLMQELDALLRKLAEGPNRDRDRRIFWLYYRVGLTAQAIAALPSVGLGVKGVESTILRLTRLLRQEIGRGRFNAGADKAPAEGI